MCFFSAQSLLHKLNLSIPVLFLPFPFFLFLAHQRFRELFSFPRLTSPLNYQSLARSPENWYLATRLNVHYSVNIFLPQTDLCTALSYCDSLSSPFSYCVSIVCMNQRTETGSYLRPWNMYFHFYISSIQDSAQQLIFN